MTDMADHDRLASERVYAGRLLKIDRDRVKLPNGRETTLEMVRHPGASAIVPFVTPDDILLIRQFRYAAGGFILEVPAGTLNPGEEPEACARREVEEEAGHRAGRLERLASIYTTPGFTDEVIHLWAAYDLTPVGQNLDHDEVLTVERLPLAEAIERIGRGDIVDSKTICALLLADRRGRPSSS
jgi:ADP-ribose pyrophosphatase